MQLETFNYLSLSGLLTCILSVATCIFIFFHRPRKATSITWSLVNLFLALWSLGLFLGWSTTEYEIALFWSRWLNLWAIFIPLFLIHFVLSFLEKVEKHRKVLYASYLITIVYFLAALLMPGHFVESVSPKGGFLFYPDAGIVYYFFPFQFSFLALWGIFELYRALKSATGQKKTQLQYLFPAILIGFGGGSTTFYLVFDINIYPFGAIGVVLLDLIFTYTIVKHELLDIKIFISRGVARLTTYLFIIGLYASIYFFIHVFIKSYSIIFALFVTPVYFILALESYPFIRNRIQTIPDAIIVKSRYDLDKVKDIFSREMEKVVNLDGFFNMLDSFFSSIGLHPVNFYIPDNFEDKNERADNYFRWDRDQKKVNKDSPLNSKMNIISHAFNSTSAIIYDRADKPAREEMNLLGADCIIPVVFKEELLCLIVISKNKTNKVEFTSIDEALFLLISREIVLVLNRLRPYEKLHTDYEKSRKLAEEAVIHKQYTQVARQIAHDIRNPAGAMILLTQYAQKIINKNEFSGKDELLEFFDDIIYDAGRISKAADTYLKYAFADPDDKLMIDKKPVNVNELLTKTINLFRGKGLVQQIRIVSELDEELPLITAEPLRLNRAFFNLILNATEAMPKGGVITVRSSSSNFAHQGHAPGLTGIRIEVRDDGPGIEQDKLKKIFDPYYTTKPDGSGLGLSIVHDIITKVHKGTLTVESWPGSGTSFKIDLPVTVHNIG